MGARRTACAVAVLGAGLMAGGCQDTVTVAVLNGCGTTIEVDARQREDRAPGYEDEWRELASGEVRAVRTITADAEEVFVVVRDVGVEPFSIGRLPSPDGLGLDVEADVVVVVDGAACTG